jgi:hypothetical protein
VNLSKREADMAITVSVTAAGGHHGSKGKAIVARIPKCPALTPQQNHHSMHATHRRRYPHIFDSEILVMTSDGVEWCPIPAAYAAAAADVEKPQSESWRFQPAICAN